MNGKQAKRLRKTLAKALGEPPRKAYGHVRYVAEHLSIPDEHSNKVHSVIHWKEFKTDGLPDVDQWRVFKRAVKRGEIKL